MRTALAPLTFVLFILGASSVRAQAPARPWQLGAGVTLYHVDDLAGTPLAPAFGVARDIGRRGFGGLELAVITDAGFYSLTALALDLDLGIRVPLDRFEVRLSAGPAGLLGGDSDGTPYYSIGAHASVGATYRLSERIGIVARGRFRQWITSPAKRSPSLFLGLVVTL